MKPPETSLQMEIKTTSEEYQLFEFLQWVKELPINKLPPVDPTVFISNGTMKGNWINFLEKVEDRDFKVGDKFVGNLIRKINDQLASGKDDEVTPVSKPKSTERGYIYNLTLLNERIEAWRSNGCRRVRTECMI